MTFDELPIYVAIHNIYPTVDEPRSDAWLTDRADELCRLIWWAAGQAWRLRSPRLGWWLWWTLIEDWD